MSFQRLAEGGSEFVLSQRRDKGMPWVNVQAFCNDDEFYAQSLKNGHRKKAGNIAFEGKWDGKCEFKKEIGRKEVPLVICE